MQVLHDHTCHYPLPMDVLASPSVRIWGPDGWFQTPKGAYRGQAPLEAIPRGQEEEWIRSKAALLGTKRGFLVLLGEPHALPQEPETTSFSEKGLEGLPAFAKAFLL